MRDIGNSGLRLWNLRRDEDLIQRGIRNLPFVLPTHSYNDDTLFGDEAKVWKRVIQYRVSSYFKPKSILETHVGRGVGTAYLMNGNINAQHFAPKKWQDYGQYTGMKFDLIDIDPYGQAYDIIDAYLPLLNNDAVLMITNGEAMNIWRHQPTAKYKSKYSGNDLPKWAIEEYIPRIEDMAGLRVIYWYLFPTIIRTVSTNMEYSTELFEDCPQLMRFSW